MDSPPGTEGWLRHPENAAKPPLRRRRGGHYTFRGLTTPSAPTLVAFGIIFLMARQPLLCKEGNTFLFNISIEKRPPGMSVFEWCQLIQDSPFSTAIRESRIVFPIIEGTHVLTLALSVGMVMWFDLRLLGISMRRHTVSETFGYVKPWMFSGFIIMFTSGGLLFWSQPLRCYVSGYFLAKLILLVLAGVNVMVYHFTIDRSREQWDKSPIPPLQARLAGLVSLLLWMGVIAVGRIMAYTF